MNIIETDEIRQRGWCSRNTVSRCVLLFSLLALLFACEPVAASPVDPYRLKEQMLSEKSSTALRSFLRRHDLVAEENMRTVINGGDRGPIVPNGLNADIFRKNLFGDATKEAVLQVRFEQSLYSLTFFYRRKGEWHRVPGVISINRDMPSNVPCGAEPKCPGYFCLEFEEARTKDEYIIAGRTFGGWCGSGSGRGDRFNLLMWQVTQKGIHKVFEDVFYKHTYNSANATVTGHTEKEIEFVELRRNRFPRKLVIVESQFDLPDEGVSTDEIREVGRKCRVVNLDYVSD